MSRNEYCGLSRYGVIMTVCANGCTVSLRLGEVDLHIGGEVLHQRKMHLTIHLVKIQTK